MPTFYTKLDSQQPILWGSMNLWYTRTKLWNAQQQSV